MRKSENIILLRHGVFQRHQNSFHGCWKAFFVSRHIDPYSAKFSLQYFQFKSQFILQFWKTSHSAKQVNKNKYFGGNMFLTFQWFVLRRQCKGRRRMETNNGKWDRQMLLQSGPDANLPDCQNWNKWGGTESDTAQAKYRHRVRHTRMWLASTIS